jgi:hypothetical protein
MTSNTYCVNTGLKEALYIRQFLDRNVTFIVLSCEVKLPFLMTVYKMIKYILHGTNIMFLDIIHHPVFI